ncbi:MAG: hypothetical protein FJ098_15650 [Deltaproteobacteria bacterium]|nr:hypothetical protein [Deltaproteobacteria bacterium]
MTRSIFVLAVLALVPITAEAGSPPAASPEDVAPSWYKAGTVLTWGVDAMGRQYDFVVTVKKLGPEIEFDWRMTEPANKEGSVKMTEAALRDADRQHNMFSGGPLTLEDKTTVWVSQAVLKQYRVKMIDHRIDTGSGYQIFLPEDEAIVPYKVLVDGVEQEYKVLHLKADCSGGDDEHLWILDNLAAPVIFKMDLGWTIWLKEIRSAK